MFIVGEQYSKKRIYELLNVPKEVQGGAWDTGYRLYKEEIFIFTNIGVSGRTGHDYKNYWEGQELIWFAKTGTQIHQPLMVKMLDGRKRIHIFARTDNQAPFSYIGIGLPKSFENVSPVKVRWVFSDINSYLDYDQAWNNFIDACQRSIDNEEVYYAPIEGYKFKLVKAKRNGVLIKIMDSEPKSEAKLSSDVFKNCLKKMIDCAGVLEVGRLYPNVAIETTVVEYSHMLDWDEDFKNVILSRLTTNRKLIPGMIDVTEAKNDTVVENIVRNLRLRQGQNKLRKNLFIVYDGKCCITQTTIKETLHACHITPHHLGGDNRSTNALLMRADVHDLFDAGFIKVDPESMNILVSDYLKKTEYYKYNGKKISNRIDGKSPNKENLQTRWLTSHIQLHEKTGV